MKKSILLTIAMIAGFMGMQASAQTTFGLRAGVNFFNVTGKDNMGNNLDDNKLKTGFNVGLNAEIPIAPDYFIQPGVLYSTKGTKNDAADTKLTLSYVEIPVNFLYKPMLGTGNLLLGFGPYVGFGIGGNMEMPNGNKMDVEFENEAGLTTTAPTFRRMDGGANFLAGYEFSQKISFQLNAQLGLLKINPDYNGVGNDETSLKNTGFGVSVGYRF